MRLTQWGRLLFALLVLFCKQKFSPVHMPILDVITREEHETALARLEAKFCTLLNAYVHKRDRWLDTQGALEVSGVLNRETLEKYKRAIRPGIQQEGRITYRKLGRKCEYLESSCVDYAQRKLGQPALAA
jgi:hypothetical protein